MKTRSKLSKRNKTNKNKGGGPLSKFFGFTKPKTRNENVNACKAFHKDRPDACGNDPSVALTYYNSLPSLRTKYRNASYKNNIRDKIALQKYWTATIQNLNGSMDLSLADIYEYPMDGKSPISYKKDPLITTASVKQNAPLSEKEDFDNFVKSGKSIFKQSDRLKKELLTSL
jgi:hypothetical protein